MSENNGFFSEENLNRLDGRFTLMSQVSRQFGSFANTAMESVAELGVFIPMLEILVTIGAFIGAGLADSLGYEVLAGLVFAQVAALYLVSHYKTVAMAGLGQAAIYASVVIGAANTALAIYLALTAHGDATGVPVWIWQFPAYSSGAAILFFYIAKLFTHESVANRRRLRVESENEIAEIQRSQAAKRAMNAARDDMQQTRLTMEAEAMERLANDDTMKQIQTKAMFLTFANDIMNQYQIAPNSKLGKQLLSLADKAVSGEQPSFDLSDLQPILGGNGHRNGNGHGADFLAPNGYRNGA